MKTNIFVNVRCGEVFVCIKVKNKYNCLKMPQVSCGWHVCPSEILIIIFKQLDAQSLWNCTLVSRSWRDVADYIGQHHGVWQELVEKSLINKAATFRSKSNLDWLDIYLNSLLWQYVSNADTEMCFMYELKHVLNMHIYKDNLIIIDHDSVKYFDIKCCQLRKNVSNSCTDFEESDNMIVSTDCIHQMNKLTLYGKIYITDFNLTKNLTVQEGIDMYKLEGNICYALDYRNTLWALKWERGQWSAEALARYYGCDSCVLAMHVHCGTVCVMVKGGDILQVDRDIKCFKRLLHLSIPTYITEQKPVMFHKHSIIVGVPSNESTLINYESCEDAIVLGCPDMTCATQHGNILFVGFRDGSVKIYLHDNLKYRNAVPDLSLNVRHYEECLIEPSIKALDVHELKGAHYLFIATVCRIYQVLIAHPAADCARNQTNKEDT